MIEAKAETVNDETLSAIREACSLIAPSWPLDRFIAVNPLWECRQQP